MIASKGLQCVVYTSYCAEGRDEQMQGRSTASAIVCEDMILRVMKWSKGSYEGSTTTVESFMHP